MKRDLMQEERQKLAEVKVKNWFVNMESGESLLFYCDQKNVGPTSIQKFVEKILGRKVVEVYHVPQEDLQYYCIDERVWIDTPEKAAKLLSTIAA